MRHIWAVLPFLTLIACGTDVAPPAGGVGFGSYEDYLSEKARLEAERAQAVQPGMVVSPESTAPVAVIPAPASTGGSDAPDIPDPVEDTLALEKAYEEPVVTVDPSHAGICDEQNFGAVSARESIESDRERLEKQREQFQVIEPTNLPKRRGNGGPNIVAFALSTTNSVGQQIHVRGPFKDEATTKRNCARYLSADLAQEAFLAAGGPKRDPKRLDPDGDGFACGWDPAPFRVVRN